MNALANVKRIDAVTVILTLTKNPVRGKTLTEYLEDQCNILLGKTEMAFCGSRWRGRISEDPHKMERVLAELQTQQKEGLAVRNPGAYAEDLWKRFQ